MRHHLLAVLVLLLLAPMGGAQATTYATKEDNEIVALDGRTGALLWRHRPATLSDAHFEVYPEGLVAFPHYSQADRGNALFLDRRRGTPVAPFTPDARRRLARSSTFHPQPQVVLANGWTLHGFSRGNTKDLTFRDAAGKEVWVARSPEYPEFVRGHANLVIWAYGYLTHQAVVHAQEAGAAAPRWTLDVNRLLGRDPKERLERVMIEVLDGTLYAEANEHLFAVQPDTGRVLWHVDLTRATRLRFRPDFFGGALNLASMAKERDLLVVAFERRVLALDLRTRKVLWHVVPDTFPHCPFPAVANGTVFLTAGARRTAPVVP